MSSPHARRTCSSWGGSPMREPDEVIQALDEKLGGRHRAVGQAGRFYRQAQDACPRLRRRQDRGRARAAPGARGAEESDARHPAPGGGGGGESGRRSESQAHLAGAAPVVRRPLRCGGAGPGAGRGRLSRQLPLRRVRRGERQRPAGHARRGDRRSRRGADQEPGAGHLGRRRSSGRPRAMRGRSSTGRPTSSIRRPWPRRRRTLARGLKRVTLHDLRREEAPGDGDGRHPGRRVGQPEQAETDRPEVHARPQSRPRVCRRWPWWARP